MCSICKDYMLRVYALITILVITFSTVQASESAPMRVQINIDSVQDIKKYAINSCTLFVDKNEAIHERLIKSYNDVQIYNINNTLMGYANNNTLHIPQIPKIHCFVSLDEHMPDVIIGDDILNVFAGAEKWPINSI